MKKILFAVIVLSFLSSGCFWGDKKVRGNGIIKTRKVDISKFSKINVSDAVQVYLTQEPIYSAVIETDENLLDLIEVDATYRSDLNIKVANGYNLKPSRTIKVYVSSPMVRIFDASGASSIYAENLLDADNSIYITASGASNVSLNLKTETIDADASGASNITVKGDTKSMEAKASGSSTVKCFNLNAESITANAAGASKVEVNCNVLLNADASGASSISFKGNASLTQNTSGAGTITKVN